MLVFCISGLPHQNEHVYFWSQNRRPIHRYYSLNDYINEYRIPEDFYKKHFKYRHRDGLYVTTLRYRDIEQFRTKYYLGVAITNKITASAILSGVSVYRYIRENYYGN